MWCYKTKSNKSSSNTGGVNYNSMGDDQVPDLEEVVVRWAKLMFDTTKNKDQARIPKEYLQFNVQWKNVKFIFGEPSYDIIPFTKGGVTAKRAAHNPTAPPPTVQPSILFKTIFRNNTGGEQEYSFKTERATRSTATVCVEKGFSRGAEFEFKLKTPCEIAEAAAGFKTEMSLINMGEDIIEEELIWGVDNVVRVPPKTETIAELIITEAQCQGSFKTETKFKGRIIVTVTNMHSNNELVTILEGQIRDILAREMRNAPNPVFRFDDQGYVRVETVGKCNFKYGVEQKIQLFEKPM